MKKYYCDICGNETNYHLWVRVDAGPELDIKSGDLQTLTIRKDLCTVCYNHVYNKINKLMEEE